MRALPRRAPRAESELLPGLSLRTGLILVLGVWALVTLFLVHHHSFVAVSKFDYALHVQQAQFEVQLYHVNALTTTAAQAAAIVPVHRGEQEYALLLLANYYGKSSLHLFQPPETITQLAVLQTDCGHSWATWELGGKQWAAVANYCTKEPQGKQGVVIYELEQLETASQQQLPDWGFKAAAALPAAGASSVRFMTTPRGQALLAVAEYTGSTLSVYGLAVSEDGALHTSEVQRVRLPGVSALATCAWGFSGSGGSASSSSSSSSSNSSGNSGQGLSAGANSGEKSKGGASSSSSRGPRDLFLMGLSYYDNGFSTRSLVYRWNEARQQFTMLQSIPTEGAHGGACFAAGGSLFLAVANAQLGDRYDTNSTIWRYDMHVDRFLLYQSVPTRGAHDVRHAHVEGDDLLVFANRGEKDTCSGDERSPVLAWRAGRQRWEEAGHLTGECLTGLAFGVVDGAGYLVATGDKNATGSYEGPLTHMYRVSHVTRR